MLSAMPAIAEPRVNADEIIADANELLADASPEEILRWAVWWSSIRG